MSPWAGRFLLELSYKEFKLCTQSIESPGNSAIWNCFLKEPNVLPLTKYIGQVIKEGGLYGSEELGAWFLGAATPKIA